MIHAAGCAHSTARLTPSRIDERCKRARTRFGARPGDADMASQRRSLQAIRLAARVATVIIVGLASAHVAELPGKLRLAGPDWLIVQQTLYIGFGPIGAIVEPMAVLLTWVLAWRLRRRPGFRMSVVAAVATSVGLIAWALIVAPMNAELNAWTPRTLPASWVGVRNRWEFGHALHALLFWVAFLALAFGVVRDRDTTVDAD
jgi:hypothetical protein